MFHLSLFFFIQTEVTNFKHPLSGKDVNVSLPPAAEECARPAPSSVRLSASPTAAIGLLRWIAQRSNRTWDLVWISCSLLTFFSVFFPFFHFPIFPFFSLFSCSHFFNFLLFLSILLFAPCFFISPSPGPPRPPVKYRLFTQRTSFKARFWVTEEERRNAPTIARTGTFCYSRAWNLLTPTHARRWRSPIVCPRILVRKVP